MYLYFTNEHLADAHGEWVMLYLGERKNKLNSQWVIIASLSLSGSAWGWIFAGPVPADLGRSPELSHTLLICMSVYWAEWERWTGNSERADSFLLYAQ